MSKKIRPVDVILAHPDELGNIVITSELDKELLESIQWGFALHPNEASNTRRLPVDSGTEIDWSGQEGFDDVRAFVAQATVTPRFPIAGIAEHVISLRRLCNAQPDVVREGEAWQSGTAYHLKDILQNCQ